MRDWEEEARRLAYAVALHNQFLDETKRMAEYEAWVDTFNARRARAAAAWDRAVKHHPSFAEAVKVTAENYDPSQTVVADWEAIERGARGADKSGPNA